MRSRFILGILASLPLLFACDKQSDTIPVTGIAVDPTSVELVDGESFTVTATIYPVDATNKRVKWTSSNPSILVADGKITTSFKSGTSPSLVNGKPVLGHGTVTATSEDGNKKAQCQVTVFANTAAVTDIRLSETSLQLKKGESHALTATVLPDNAIEKTVKWTSSDNTVASVDQTGTITAIGGGKALITASAGGVSSSCSVDVVVPVESIGLNVTLLALEIGDFALLTATVLPDDAMDKKVQWGSDNPDVATVDQNGRVTAVSVGKAKITASAGNISVSCSVICVDVPVTAVVLDKTFLSLEKGSSETLTATVLPKNATDKTVQWSSDNLSVATVDQNGRVIAVNSGEATITAVAGDVSETCTVSVFIPVTSVTLNPTSLMLSVGETAFLDATVLPEDASENTLTWYSSHSDIASVQGGSITAISFGWTVITAQIGDQFAYCTVTVVTDSSSGVTASCFGGELRINDGLVLGGSRLDFGVSNFSSRTITVKTVQLVDGESGIGSDTIDIDCSLESGNTLPWSVEVPASGIHSPVAIFTFTYLGGEFTCSAAYHEPIEQSIFPRLSE